MFDVALRCTALPCSAFDDDLHCADLIACDDDDTAAACLWPLICKIALCLVHFIRRVFTVMSDLIWSSLKWIGVHFCVVLLGS